MTPIGDTIGSVIAANKLVAIVGPTASGKTELAMELAAKVDGEIISADSVQVYRRFDVGSGKPSDEELRRTKHHLISILDPLDAIDAARFAALADAAILDVRQRGKVPIVCGGTFMWVKALLQGLVAAPPASESIRDRHRTIAQDEGRPALHERLREVDPAAAARLHPNDAMRVSRALEVFELSGEKMSDMQSAHAFKSPRYDYALFARAHDPSTLTERIERRARIWLENGWIEEVRAIIADGFGDARAMSSVGYRQIAAHVRGEVPRAELLELIVRSTRVFARRQRTWLNHEPVTWLP